MYDVTDVYNQNTQKPFNKEKRDKFVKYHDIINGYFMRLIREDYKFGYDINLRLDDNPTIFCEFVSKNIGEVEMYFDNWTNKLVIKDYHRHNVLFFNDAESLIVYFKEVYFPILEAEDNVDNLKGKIND